MFCILCNSVGKKGPVKKDLGPRVQGFRDHMAGGHTHKPQDKGRKEDSADARRRGGRERSRSRERRRSRSPRGEKRRRSRSRERRRSRSRNRDDSPFSKALDNWKKFKKAEKVRNNLFLFLKSAGNLYFFKGHFCL